MINIFTQFAFPLVPPLRKSDSEFAFDLRKFIYRVQRYRNKKREPTINRCTFLSEAPRWHKTLLKIKKNKNFLSRYFVAQKYP